MSIGSFARRLAVLAVEKAVETGATSVASAALTKVGEAIGTQIANRISPPKPETPKPEAK